MKTKKVKIIYALSVIALIAATLLTGCNRDENPPTSHYTFEIVSEDADASREIISQDEHVTTSHVKTSKTTVGEALLELGIIDGNDTEYGLIVKVVEELGADSNSYWEFQIDGDYAMTGVDSTEIEENVVYSFVMTKLL
ncbi:MAG: DUF4430 domain-containing protein [Oscillospiraceae bacterium]|nr:DUF4430 domain-containing protein [Oscillospiraceae bacterium]